MLTRSEIEEKIPKWITDENWSYDMIEDPKHHFLCNVSDGQNTVSVGIEKRIERVVIHNTSYMNSEAQNSYKLSPNKLDFWFDLKVNLMFLGIIPMPIPNTEVLQFIDLSSMIYFDAFSRDKFIHSIIKIIEANGLCHYMWELFVDSQRPLD